MNLLKMFPDKYQLAAVGEFRLIRCVVNQSAAEIESRWIYTNSCFIEGTMNDIVKKFLYLDTCKKRVLINGVNGSHVSFYRFDFMKIIF